MDMAGNVLEWQANYFDKDHDYLGLRGGSWYYNEDNSCVSICDNLLPDFRDDVIGFRLVMSVPNG